MRLRPALAALCTAAVASALLPVAAPAQTRHAGVFAVGVGDWDGPCVFRYRALVDANAWPQPTATVGQPVRTVLAGRFVGADDRSEALTVTLRPGQAVASSDVALQATAYGTVTTLTRAALRRGGRPAAVRLAAGETVSLLGPGLDGTRLVSIRGRIYAAALPPEVAVVAEPDTRLWLRLTARAGKPAAWVLVGDPTAFQNVGCDGEGGI